MSEIKFSTTARVVVEYGLKRIKGKDVWVSLEELILELKEIRDIQPVSQKKTQIMLINFVNKLKLYRNMENYSDE